MHLQLLARARVAPHLELSNMLRLFVLVAAATPAFNAMHVGSHRGVGGVGRHHTGNGTEGLLATTDTTAAVAPTGTYCGNTSFSILFARIAMSFGSHAPPPGTPGELNVTGKVDGFPLLRCDAER